MPLSNRQMKSGSAEAQVNVGNIQAKSSSDGARKRIAIVQSNYIPWKGYFDMIASVDEFILYDDVQFTKNDWRNRNRIKTPKGPQWLTIPVCHSLNDRIRDVKISQLNWNAKHWKTLQHNYGRASGFAEAGGFLGDLYARATHSYISEINHFFILEICRFLGIDTKISWASDYSYSGDKSMRVLSLCQAAGGDIYLSGPAAQSYLDIALFSRAKVDIEWMDYSGYAIYPQQYGEFDHGLSIVDLVFNAGRGAPNFMKYMKSNDQQTMTE